MYVIMLYSLLTSISTIITTQYIKDTNIFIFIRYITDIFMIIFIYIFLLSQHEKKFVFSKKYMEVWKISFLITFISFCSFVLYLSVLKQFGPTKTKSISYTFSIIITLILSYVLLKNDIFNFNIIIGLCFIIGINLIIHNSNINF